MKFKTTFILMLGTFLSSPSAHAASTTSQRVQAFISLDGLQDGRGKVEIGDQTDVTVSVAENRSTGYSWDITKNTCGSRFLLQSDSYNQHPEADSKNNRRRLTGAPG